MPKSYLIKDTTKEERMDLVKEWMPQDDLDDCGIDIWEMYTPYIRGEKEIAECNAAFNAGFYESSDLADEVGCGMGRRQR